MQTISRHRKPWSVKEKREAARMSRTGASEDEIGQALGRTPSAVRNYFVMLRTGPEKMAEYRANRSPPVKLGPSPAAIPLGEVINRPTPEMLADRARREAMPHRDLTAAFFNDPPIGLSALDGRR